MWDVIRNITDAETHIVPRDDLKSHVVEQSCWCSPTENEYFPALWVHRSADGREMYETGAKKPQ